MCDYCGCRRSDVIAELSDEHERILELAYTLRDSALSRDQATAMAAAHALQLLLVPHTRKEEEGLFQQLRRRWETDGRLAVLVDEHREIEDLLRGITSGRGWHEAAQRATSVLSEHILAEETDLFPYALYELDADQWTMVEAVHEAVNAARPEAAAT